MLLALFLALLQAKDRLEAPATFEPGASKQATRSADLPLRPRLLKEYEALATAGAVADLVRDDSKWMPYILNGLLSDDEKVARSSFQALSDHCVKRKISSSEEGFRNPVRLELFNSAYYRAGDYTFWTEWWLKTADHGLRSRSDPAARMKWDELMQYLRAGGGFDDPKRPEGMAFAKVKALGPAAYPHLARYVDHGDILLARAAVRVLNLLTDRDALLPTEDTKARLKAEWEAWVRLHVPPFPPIAPQVVALLACEAAEADVRTLVGQLSSERAEERMSATAALKPCALRHETLLRTLLAESRDPEVRWRIATALEDLE